MSQKQPPKRVPKGRNYIVRDMILTRKGGRMRDKRDAEGSRSLLKTDEDEDEIPSESEETPDENN